MSDFLAYRRKPARAPLAWVLTSACILAACDSGSEGGGVDGGDAGASDTSGDAPGVDAGAGAPDLAAQDLTPVTITRPVVGKPGTRLRGRFVQSRDGAQERWGLWDSEFQTRCGLQTAEDGRVRCLPLAPSSWSLDYVTGYTDAGCTEVALPEAAACTGGFGFKVTPMGRAVHRLGPAVERTVLYQRYTSSGVLKCEPLTLPAPVRYFTLAEKIEPTAFVARVATRSEGTATQRITFSFDELADGTRMMTSIVNGWDNQLEAYCRPMRADDGWLRCLPTYAMTASSVRFSDDRCTRSVAQSFSTTPEKYALFADNNTCSSRRRVFRVGAAVPPGSTYRIINERCVAAPADTGSYYLLGEELPPHHFVPFRPARVGTGRLEERYFVNDQGVALREFTSLWDSQLGQLCTFHVTSSGRRCVPYGWTGTYADKTCSLSARSAAATTPPCGLSTPDKPMVSLVAGSWCAPEAVPTLLGPSVPMQPPGQTFTRSSSSGLCTSTTYFDGGDFRPLAGPADLTMFVEGTEAMD